MVRQTSTRRQFTTGLAAIGSLALAGCLDGDSEDESPADDSSGDLSDWEPTDRYTVTMHFENEAGEPISSGIEGTAEPEDGSKAAYTITSTGIEEGTLSDKLGEGEYTITVTSTDGSFDDVEKDVTVEGETDVTFVLDGAQPAE
ncbi:S-layer protein [Halovivax cerinus]|uniref:S-layer protein n=1 Tax=Halovivax cerinus TaxID=1487865 RepID=A0ABD5NNK6_9EURY|nr:S-layer protein [Halovivax cerinus]